MTDRKEKMEEEVLFGKYRILQLIANGSGGEVFLAEHKVLGEKRIIKRLYKKRPFYRERLREAHILKQLHHVAIPCIYDIEEDATASYIIEEDMGGEPLSEVLAGQKCLSTSFISHYSIQLCEIIEYLHEKGILYLDIKPENLMVKDDTLSLIDFGGAMEQEDSRRVLFGTDGYAAPEQYQGQAGEQSDVYGIGRIIGLMMGQGNKKDRELREIYERCVRQIPSERYGSVAKLREALVAVGKSKRKQRRKKASEATLYIGIAAAHEGADTAAISTLFATQLNERESGRIAVVDLSGQHVLQNLYESLHGTRRSVPEKFVLHGITYMAGQSEMVIGRCAAMGFRVVILNFGTNLKRYSGEFFRCGRRFLAGDLYPWRLRDWERFSEEFPENVLQNGITALIFGGEKADMPLPVKQVVYVPSLRDVLYAERGTERFFRRLF